MATYQVTSPDGRKFRITAPDRATQDQILAYAQQQFSQAAGNKSSPQGAAQAPTTDELSRQFYAAKAQGREDDARAIVGYMQNNGMTLAPMSEAERNAAHQKEIAQNVSDMGTVGRFVAGVGEGAKGFLQGVKQNTYDRAADALTGGNRVAQDEARIAEQRRLSQALNNTTSGTIGNILGGAAESAPLVLIPGGGATTLGRVAAGVGTGALAGYLAPEASSSEHRANTAIGAILGGGAPAVSGAGRLAIRGAATPEARQLIDAGVKLTPGQTVGGALRRVEDGLTSVPVVGDLIRNSQRRSVESFNKASMNRALEPLGESIPADVQAGHDAIRYGADVSRKAYDAALKGTATKADAPMMEGIARTINSLPGRVQDKVADVLQTRVFPAIDESKGTLTGQQFKDMTSGVLGDMRAMGRSTDPVERGASSALRGILDDLNSAFARSNGAEAAAKLANADRAYRGFTQLQDAASHSSQGSNGVFTPAQFRSAVRRGDSSKGKSAFGRGNAFMQDLADTATNVLPRTVPDSGTPYRMFVGAGSLGGIGSLANIAGFGSVAHATLPAATLMGAYALPYTRAGGRVAQALLAPEIGPVRGGAMTLADILGGYGQSRALPIALGVDAARRDTTAPPIPPALPAPPPFAGN
jgi:hypothetical protein